MMLGTLSVSEGKRGMIAEYPIDLKTIHEDGWFWSVWGKYQGERVRFVVARYIKTRDPTLHSLHVVVSPSIKKDGKRVTVLYDGVAVPCKGGVGLSRVVIDPVEPSGLANRSHSKFSLPAAWKGIQQRHPRCAYCNSIKTQGKTDCQNCGAPY